MRTSIVIRRMMAGAAILIALTALGGCPNIFSAMGGSGTEEKVEDQTGKTVDVPPGGSITDKNMKGGTFNNEGEIKNSTFTGSTVNASSGSSISGSTITGSSTVNAAAGSSITGSKVSGGSTVNIDTGNAGDGATTIENSEFSGSGTTVNVTGSGDAVEIAGNTKITNGAVMNVDGPELDVTGTLTIDGLSSVNFTGQGVGGSGSGSIVIAPGGKLVDNNQGAGGNWAADTGTSIVVNYGAEAYAANGAALIIGMAKDDSNNPNGTSGTNTQATDPLRIILTSDSSITLLEKGYVVSGTVKISGIAGSFALDDGYTLTGTNNGDIIEIPKDVLLGFNANGCIPGLTIGGTGIYVGGAGTNLIDTSSNARTLTWNGSQWDLAP